MIHPSINVSHKTDVVHVIYIFLIKSFSIHPKMCFGKICPLVSDIYEFSNSIH